ncbi:MAG: hypothetical protein ACP5NL_01435 [Thermoplasmata archaeon]
MKIEDLVKLFNLNDREIAENLMSSSCNATITELKEIYNILKSRKNELEIMNNQAVKKESEIAGLKFEYFSMLKDNQILAINLSGLLAENEQLKKKLWGSKNDENIADHALIDRYLFMFRK